MLKVSVITMTYNDCENLEKCVEQIVAQDYEAMEYIIVDGGSSDGTAELIRRTEERLGDRMKWVSEPDRGLYDALNKGIRMATGDIVGIMCDEFADSHVVSRIAETIERTGCDGVHGDIDYVDGGRIVRKWRMGRGSIRTGWMPGHPTLYLRREVYEKYGLYKTDFKIAADYEFMIRILKDGQVSLAYIDEVLVHMFHGENSTSTGGFANYLESFREGLRALKENHIPFAFVVNCFRTVRVLWQFVKGKVG
ncbi:MAG: glycosyltransferase [Lachnospiraceae bacterium]|nr:glycosyltransferase [Lachnospiraceae bacterium]